MLTPAAAFRRTTKALRAWTCLKSVESNLDLEFQGGVAPFHCALLELSTVGGVYEQGNHTVVKTAQKYMGI